MKADGLFDDFVALIKEGSQSGYSHWEEATVSLLVARASREIDKLQQRIAALERLVPEANLLMRILRPDRTIADAKQIFLLSETIREYREGK